MIRLVVSYEKGNYYECDNVERIVYNDFVGNEVSVEGDALLSHHFPIGTTLWVHTSTGASSVSGTGVRAIDVYKE